MSDTTVQEITQEIRDAKGRFLPGVSGNPGGSIGKNKCARDIQDAIEEFEREKGISYWKAATLIAMRLADKGNTTLLGKILDKFVGSKVEIEGIEQGAGETRIVIIRPDKTDLNKTDDGQTDNTKTIPG